MDHTLFSIGNSIITPWTIIGFLGATIFAGRWLLQVYVSHLKKQSIVPTAFWYMSATGNILLLLYFIFGIRDSVGIVSNLFPLLVASYNILLIRRKMRPNEPSPLRGLKDKTDL